MRTPAQATPLVPPAVQASTVRASVLVSGERRLEAETYLSDGYLLRQRIEAIASDHLEQLARVWQPGRLKGIQVSADKGVPFLAATQVFDIRPTPRKWLSTHRTPDAEERFVKHDWILVTRSGSVGNTIMTYRPLDGLIISDDLLRVVPLHGEDRGYLYAYLRTRYARGMMRSTKYGNIIKHLEPEHLQVIPVVRASTSIKATLDDAIVRCFARRNEAYELLLSAETLFSETIGAVDFTTAELGFPVKARDMFRRSRRLDAYSHNPLAGAIIRALGKTKKPVVPLRQVSDRVFLPNRFTRGTPLRQGIPLVGSEELFQVNPEIDKFLPQSAADAELLVKSGWLLVARSGQIYGINGRVVLAGPWLENKIVSEHAIRIVPREREIRPGYLSIALGHPTLGRPLVLREVFGTSIPEIDPEALREVPVVRLGEPEDVIANKAERAAVLRALADELEDAVVAVLEAAIAHALGDAPDDAIDAALARLRLAEIADEPEKVLRGAKLEKRMQRWQS